MQTDFLTRKARKMIKRRWLGGCRWGNAGNQGWSPFTDEGGEQHMPLKCVMGSTTCTLSVTEISLAISCNFYFTTHFHSKINFVTSSVVWGLLAMLDICQIAFSTHIGIDGIRGFVLLRNSICEPFTPKISFLAKERKVSYPWEY